MNAEHFPGPNRPRAWIVIPTYNERENVERLVAAVRASVPDASILIVDDGSPDGTGQLADLLASADEAVHVLHRSTKDGLGQAYRAGFATVLSDPSCGAVVQMDCAGCGDAASPNAVEWRPLHPPPASGGTAFRHHDDLRDETDRFLTLSGRGEEPVYCKPPHRRARSGRACVSAAAAAAAAAEG